MVVRRQGMGSFVLPAPRIANPLDEAIDFRELIQRNHCCPELQYLSTGLVTLNETLTAALDQPDGSALRRHTLFTADGDPVIYCINTFPRWVLPDDVVPQVIADQRVEVSRATIWPDIARNCDIPEGLFEPLMPVLVLEEIGYNSAGRPVLHSLEYYPGRFMRFEFIRRRGVSREWVKS